MKRALAAAVLAAALALPGVAVAESVIQPSTSFPYPDAVTGNMTHGGFDITWSTGEQTHLFTLKTEDGLCRAAYPHSVYRRAWCFGEYHNLEIEMRDFGNYFKDHQQ